MAGFTKSREKWLHLYFVLSSVSEVLYSPAAQIPDWCCAPAICVFSHQWRQVKKYIATCPQGNLIIILWNSLPNWWNITVIPATDKQRQANLCEFQVNLVYKTSSSAVRTVSQRNLLSKIRNSQLLKVQSISACRVYHHKRDVYTAIPSHQAHSPSWKIKEKQCNNKSLEMTKSKQCLLEITRPLHTWTSYVCLHKTKTINISPWSRTRLMNSIHIWGTIDR